MVDGMGIVYLHFSSQTIFTITCQGDYPHIIAAATGNNIKK